MTTPRLYNLTVFASLATFAWMSCSLMACVGGDPSTPETQPNPVPGGASGGEDNTFDHPDTQPDIWELYERMQEEGPPKYTARVHSCPKVRYRTLGNLLTSRGVDLAGGADTAGSSYMTSGQALGRPNYGARKRENLDLTTASASKLFDIFVQAAPEIITTMPSRPECMIDGVGATMFNDLGQCSADGITCLLGVPATAAHLELCNATVTNASDPTKGKAMAVALLAAAGHTCE
jgi:hypothetical protein